MNKPEILIVEDDKAIKNLISTTLELEGYRYHTAENGAQAILSAAILCCLTWDFPTWTASR